MGHPTADQTPIPAEVAELLAARIMRGVVEDAQGCWIRTTRRPTPSGYTHISRQVGGVRTYYYAHRVMYVAAKGAIPSGMTVDHLCENPPCCNPDHLKAGPHHANIIRSENNFYAINARKTHCVRGHELPPYHIGGQRRCRECNRIRQADYVARRRAVGA